MKILIGNSGEAKMLYTEDVDISGFGGVKSISRASHVEPLDSGKWIADMGPSSGPVLGPFNKRSEALAAEVEWLEKNVLGGEND